MEDIHWSHIWVGRLVLVTNIMKSMQPYSILTLTAFLSQEYSVQRSGWRHTPKIL